MISSWLSNCLVFPSKASSEFDFNEIFSSPENNCVPKRPSNWYPFIFLGSCNYFSLFRRSPSAVERQTERSIVGGCFFRRMLMISCGRLVLFMGIGQGCRTIRDNSRERDGAKRTPVVSKWHSTGGSDSFQTDFLSTFFGHWVYYSHGLERLGLIK